MGGLVWASIQRRWLRLIGFALMLGGAFVGRPTGSVVIAVGATLFVGDIVLAIAASRRQRIRLARESGETGSR
jgi:hypothetical protein